MRETSEWLHMNVITSEITSIRPFIHWSGSANNRGYITDLCETINAENLCQLQYLERLLYGFIMFLYHFNEKWNEIKITPGKSTTKTDAISYIMYLPVISTYTWTRHAHINIVCWFTCWVTHGMDWFCANISESRANSISTPIKSVEYLNVQCPDFMDIDMNILGDQTWHY